MRTNTNQSCLNSTFSIGISIGRIVAFSTSVTTALMFIGMTGCAAKLESEVHIRTNASREVAAPILGGFDRLHPKCTLHREFAKIDADSVQPVDCLWDVDLRTLLQMQRSGELAKTHWDLPSNWPETFRAKDGSWVGIAAEALVLVVNTEKLPDLTQRPSSVLDLADDRWNGEVALAGSANSSVELLLEILRTNASRIAIPSHLQNKGFNQAGVLDFDAWKGSLGSLLSGPEDERSVLESVAAGKTAWGIVRSSSALAAKESGAPIEISFPDQFSGGFGTILIPQGVAVSKLTKSPNAARQLANYLVSLGVEARMVMGNAGCLPIHPQSKEKSRLKDGEQVRWAIVDFERIFTE